MTRLTYLLCLLVAMTLACGVSSPSQAKPTPLTGATAENTLTPPKSKPTNAPNNGFMSYDTTVTADLLNIRTAPMGEIITHVWLIEGEQVTVIECLGVWGRIGIDRWINTNYLETGCE